MLGRVMNIRTLPATHSVMGLIGQRTNCMRYRSVTGRAVCVASKKRSAIRNLISILQISSIVPRCTAVVSQNAGTDGQGWIVRHSRTRRAVRAQGGWVSQSLHVNDVKLGKIANNRNFMKRLGETMVMSHRISSPHLICEGFGRFILCRRAYTSGATSTSWGSRCMLFQSACRK